MVIREQEAKPREDRRVHKLCVHRARVVSTKVAGDVMQKARMKRKPELSIAETIR